MDIYNRIQGITDRASRNKAIKALSESDKKAYVNYQSNLRKKRFLSDPNMRAKVYADNASYKERQRKANPEKARALVRKYVQDFRARLKTKKKQEAHQVASDVLGSIIDNTFKTVDRKKKASHMRAYRACNKAS